jgi:MFS family permease
MKARAGTGRGATAAVRAGAHGPVIRRILLCNNVLAAIANGAWYVASPFIPVYLGTLGASAPVIGNVLGIAGIVPLLAAIPAGAVADRSGPAGIAAWAVIAYAAAGAVLAALHKIWAVMLAYTLLGAANIGFAVAAQGIVASVSPPRDRLANFGYYSLWSSAGAVVGPIVGGAITAHLGYTAAFMLTGALMVPSFFFVTGLRAVAPPAQPVVSLTNAFELVGPILRRPGIPAVLLISFLVVAGQTLQQSFYPIYLSRIGLSGTLIGIVFAAISLSSMLVRSMLSPGRERFGTTRLVLVATGLAALSLCITPWLQEFWLLVGAGALMGAGTGLAFPLTMNLMTAPVPPEYRGVAFGLRQAVQRLATVVSPIAFGAVIAAYGLRQGFIAGALVLVASMPIIAWVSGPLGRTARPPRGRR